ncbi:MAG TPA: ThiF family adenylyltransferase [Acetobacteraceae bacterium]|nr:ThiF family adenylyltransferase [Acetobacteraceae bacterium]
MDTPQAFPYLSAFQRNLGWLTEWEQLALREKTVAIAGMGGVGGVYLLTLARLGIGGFRIADPDRFELANFNRQAGATLANIGRPKAEAMAEMAREINPELRIACYGAGIRPENLDSFLDGADLFIDGFDFFEMEMRRRTFARCAELRIPAITAAPIGMGVGFLAFAPDGMGFERYFRLEGQPLPEQYLRFLMGVAPRGLHRRYLVDPGRVDIAGRKGPSTAAACQLCAGVTATAVVQVLLGRGALRPAPVHHHFDAYLGRLVQTRLRWGNAGPVQRLKLAVARRFYAEAARSGRTAPSVASPRTPIEEILTLARWAPSGDNAQPWRFEVIDESSVAVRLHPGSAGDVYDYRGGEPTLLSLGAMLETMRIAATGWSRRMEWRLVSEAPFRVLVRFERSDDLRPDPMLAMITLRRVDRRPFRLRPLAAAARRDLEASLGGRLRLRWHATPLERWRFGRLNAAATGIRLRSPECFEVHRRVIDWQNDQSPAGIPARAIGLSAPTRRLMAWAMRDPARWRMMNRLGAPLSAAVELDLVPALRSAAFFTLAWPERRAREGGTASLLAAGAAVQSLWLTAARLGLGFQPTLSPLIFTWYGQERIPFSADPAVMRRAERLARQTQQVLGAPPEDFVFMGRLGYRLDSSVVRSGRLPLADLLVGDGAAVPAPARAEAVD